MSQQDPSSIRLNHGKNIHNHVYRPAITLVESGVQNSNLSQSHSQQHDSNRSQPHHQRHDSNRQQHDSTGTSSITRLRISRVRPTITIPKCLQSIGLDLDSKLVLQDQESVPTSNLDTKLFEDHAIPFSPITVDDQDGWDPTVLLIGPGGIKGLCMLGALQVFQDAGKISNINTYIGVSIGSIISMLRAVGYSYSEICNIGRTVDLFQDWVDIDWGKIMKQRGLIDHTELRTTLTNAVRNRLNITYTPNFYQLFTLTGLTYISTCFDVTDEKPCYYSRYTVPTMSIVEAALASSSIPYLFKRFTISDHIIVDGAIIDPFPVDLVDDGSTDILTVTAKTNQKKTVEISEFEFLYRLISAPMDYLKINKIKNSSRNCRHCSILCPPNTTANFQPTDRERVKLYNVGVNQGMILLEHLQRDSINTTGSTFSVPSYPDSGQLDITSTHETCQDQSCPNTVENTSPDHSDNFHLERLREIIADSIQRSITISERANSRDGLRTFTHSQ